MPADTFQCPKCQAQLKYSSNLQPGITVRCPQCQDTFPVPAPEAATGELTQPPAPMPATGSEVTSEPTASRPTQVTDEPSSPRDRQRRYPDADEDYPPSGATFGDRDAPPLSNRYEVDLGKWFNIATAHYGSILGPSVGFMVILTAAYLVLVGGALLAGQVVTTATRVPGTESLLSGIAGVFLITPLMAGLYYVCLQQLDGRPWGFADFFVGFSGRFYGNLVVYGLLVQLAMLPYILINTLGSAIMLNGGPVQIGLGLNCASLFVLLILGMVFVRLFFLVLPLMFDRGLKPIDAIKANWFVTGRHFGMWFGVSLLLGLIMMGGACAVGIGIWFAVPFAILVQMAGYLDVAGIRAPLLRPDASSTWHENG